MIFDICPDYFERNPYVNGSWAIPEATECLQQTGFRIIPGLFLLLTTPILLYRSRFGVETRGPNQLSSLIYVKLALSFLLLLNGITLSIADALSGAVPIVYPLFFVCVLILAFSLTLICKTKGVYSSGVLFVYSVLLALLSLPEFRYRLERIIYEGPVDGARFYFTVLFFPLALVQAVLQCFSDYRWSLLRDPKRSPELKSSFLSQQLYSWCSELIVRGYKAPLTLDDVYHINDKDTCTNVLREFTRHYEKDSPQSSRSQGDYERLVSGNDDDKRNEKSFFIPLVRAHKFEIFTLSLTVFGELSTLLVPIFLGNLIEFTGNMDIPAWQGLAWAILLFVALETFSLIIRVFFYRMHLIQMNISSTLTSLVYQKALRLSNEARRGRTVGEIVNLMSVDVDNIKELFESMNIICTPLTLSICLYMLYNLLGVAAFVGFGVLLVLTAPSSYFSSKFSQIYEDDRMETRDERIKMTNEMLNGMKAVKMYTWEDSVRLIVEKLRDKELGLMAKIAYLTAFLHSCYGCIHLFVTGSAFAAYVLMDPQHNVLTPQVAFVALSLFDIIYSPVKELPFVFSGVIRFVISHKRMKSFLNEEELVNYIDPLIAPEGIVSVNHASFYWEKGAKMTLRDITMAVKIGELVAVVGEVGCGKSSLIAALLGEMTKETGEVNVAGSVAYVSQQAWIQNDTLKNNVLFGTPLNARHYNQVIESCALKPDLEMLAAGDATEIGERGINLSGGQKQRVSLARAVYSQKDIYLLDDPLSAVDAHVGKHLFDNVISSESGILKGKTRILVTHGVHFLKHCDRVIVLKDGQISEQGTYQELIASRGSFSEFLAEFVHKVIERKRTTSEMSIDAEDEELKEVIADLGTFQPEIRRRLESQMSEVSRSSVEHRAPVGEATEEENDGQLIEEESFETGEVGKGVYIGYFNAAGAKLGILFFLTFIVCGIFRFENNIWLADWSDRTVKAVDNGTFPENVATDLSIYIGLAAGEAFFYCLRTAIFALGTLRASKSLHDALLKNVLRLPMSFFDTTPLGRILNRFGKDVECSDDNLPVFLDESLFSLYETVLSLILVVRGSFYAVPLTILILVINKVIVTYYIRSSRQLKRLESITRSPIYSFFQESLQGAVTIRAYKCTGRFLEESQRRTDLNKSTFYYNAMFNQWLVVRLEFLGALLTLMAALVAVFFRGSSTISAGIIGLAVTHSLNISRMLAWTMRMMTGLENDIVAVERIKEYSHLPTEAAAESEPGNKPPREWPQKGAVEFVDLSIKYREGLDLVLKGINAKIAPGEKIGIVGRTGAGKSSLTLALFRIVEAHSGRILIDGKDISRIGLKELRSKLTIVPQDPVLFSGSFRMNLDPFGQHSDSRIWDALRVASLHEFVNSLPSRLDHEVAEGGDNLSVGQRQLVCLARAVLHRTRILVLDEAAAALDLETDALIQATIRDHFKECTVLTIAHRLNTVLDNDRVLVLDRGEVIEFDSPKNLLADEDSQFHSMAKEAGLV